MAKQKKRTLTLTENEVLAVASVVAALVTEGQIDDDHTPEMCSQFSDVMAKLSNMANAICGFEQKDNGALKDYFVESLEKRYKQIDYLLQDEATADLLDELNDD